MADGTGISWTDATWNPVRGCSRVSEGCRHCYAEQIAGRFSGPGQPYEGLAIRKLKVISDDDQKTEGRWTGEVRFVLEHLADPLRWKRARRIFANSMSDLFHEKLTNEEIAAIVGIMASAPHHIFQVLTKRAKRMREWFEWIRDRGIEQCAIEAMSRLGDSHFCNVIAAHPKWPLSNVWLGVSVEHQEAADERIPELLKTPAAVRFLSCEPLLGPVVLERDELHTYLYDDGLHWVIAGCESGHGARPCKVEWLRGLRDQCKIANVPFFLKQAVEQKDHHHSFIVADRAGSKRKGRGVIELPYLDGVQHAAFPEAV